MGTGPLYPGLGLVRGISQDTMSSFSHHSSKDVLDSQVSSGKQAVLPKRDD